MDGAVGLDGVTTAGTPGEPALAPGRDGCGPAPDAEVPHPAIAAPARTHAHATIARLRTDLIRGRLAWASAAQPRYPGRMPEEVTAVQVRPHLRLLHGMRRPANWLQLVRFGLVGGLGFAVNLAVYAFCVHVAGFDYHVAAVAAWLVAVMNNFILNRHWTFDAREGPVHFQAMRFLVVSLAAFGVSLLLLTLFVESAGIAKVPAQALAVAASMPLNFLGNKLWSFRSEAEIFPTEA